MQLYTICLANATQSDDGTSKANGDVLSIHKTLEEAKVNLEKSKNEIVAEIVHGLEGDDLEEAYEDIEIYGSVEEGYFKICNSYWDETYLKISKVRL